MQSQLVPAVTESPSAAIFQLGAITGGRGAAGFCGNDVPDIVEPDIVEEVAKTATAKNAADKVTSRFKPIIVAPFSS